MHSLTKCMIYFVYFPKIMGQMVPISTGPSHSVTIATAVLCDQKRLGTTSYSYVPKALVVLRIVATQHSVIQNLMSNCYNYGLRTMAIGSQAKLVF